MTVNIFFKAIVKSCTSYGEKVLILTLTHSVRCANVVLSQDNRNTEIKKKSIPLLSGH